MDNLTFTEVNWDKEKKKKKSTDSCNHQNRDNFGQIIIAKAYR